VTLGKKSNVWKGKKSSWNASRKKARRTIKKTRKPWIASEMDRGLEGPLREEKQETDMMYQVQPTTARTRRKKKGTMVGWLNSGSLILGKGKKGKREKGWNKGVKRKLDITRTPAGEKETAKTQSQKKRVFWSP